MTYGASGTKLDTMQHLK